MPLYRNHFWELDAGDWFIEPDEQRLVLKPPDGVGELRIDTFDATVPEAWLVMRDMSENKVLPLDVKMDIATYGPYHGISYEYTEAGSAWLEWRLQLVPIVLFVAYQCDAQHQTRHRAAVERILGSLKDCRATGAAP